MRASSGKRGLLSLRFEYDGNDMTKAESRMTQEDMDRLLGCQMLTRVVFHSQSEIAGLLEVRCLDCRGPMRSLSLYLRLRSSTGKFLLLALLEITATQRERHAARTSCAALV